MKVYFEDITAAMGIVNQEEERCTSVVEGMDMYHVYTTDTNMIVCKKVDGQEVDVDGEEHDKVIKLMENYKGGQNEEIKQ